MSKLLTFCPLSQTQFFLDMNYQDRQVRSSAQLTILYHLTRHQGSSILSFISCKRHRYFNSNQIILASYKNVRVSYLLMGLSLSALHFTSHSKMLCFFSNYNLKCNDFRGVAGKNGYLLPSVDCCRQQLMQMLVRKVLCSKLKFTSHCLLVANSAALTSTSTFVNDADYSKQLYYKNCYRVSYSMYMIYIFMCSTKIITYH